MTSLPALATRAIGTNTVHALRDGSGLFFEPLRSAFPDVSDQTWELATRLDKAANAPNGGWRLQFRCFAIRATDDKVTVVDAGIGPADSPAASWAPVPGELPEQLAAAGIEPGDVATVVITHLHTDHVGWAVVRDDQAIPRPFFPNARYLLQRTEFDAVATINPKLTEAMLDPLRATGQLCMVDGEVGLAREVRVVATPGHTPGHQSVLVEADGQALVVTGDLLVHAVQLVDPEIAYAHDMDPTAARNTRNRILHGLVGRGAVLATAHLTEAFVLLSQGVRGRRRRPVLPARPPQLP